MNDFLNLSYNGHRYKQTNSDEYLRTTRYFVITDRIPSTKVQQGQTNVVRIQVCYKVVYTNFSAKKEHFHVYSRIEYGQFVRVAYLLYQFFPYRWFSGLGMGLNRCQFQFYTNVSNHQPNSQCHDVHNRKHSCRASSGFYGRINRVCGNRLIELQLVLQLVFQSSFTTEL